MKKLLYSLSIFFTAGVSIPSASFAQITVTPSVTAAVLMNKLLGPGVIGISPTLTCASVANGTFTAVTSPLIFDSGIVLTSGRAVTGGAPLAGTGSVGPATAFASVDNLAPGDPMLSALSGGGISRNACILEFDFRPAGDTVKFDYIFGSEEYTSFTCSGYNDPFGFFISGPGYAVPTNIALVPGTTIPVCINSINCGATGGYPLATCTALGPGSPFCMYYVNNIGGPTITYDGITTKLTAIAAVTPCDTYHLKLGVADIGDSYYDSGVFLKAGSLTSSSITINPIGMNPGDTVAGSQFCVRGCLPGKFIFKRNGSLLNPMTIKYIIAGTAVNGFDYTTITDSVVIAASDSDEVVLINGLSVPPTGPKTVKLLILAPYTCGGASVIIDSAVMTIIDSFFVKINTSDTAICQGQYVSIIASGDTSLDFTWSPAGTLSATTTLNTIATPTVTTTYTLTGIFPAIGCLPSKAVIKITVYDRPILNAGPPTQITCQGTSLQLNVTAFPSGIPYTYSWTPSSYLSSAGIANPVFTPLDSVDRIQTVRVSAPVPGCSSDTSFFLHVLPNDFALYNLDTGICYPPESYQIRILGDTEFSYKWVPELGVSDPNVMSPIVSPPFTLTYTLTASYPKCPDIKHTVLYSIKNPQVNILTEDTIVCLKQPMQIRVNATPVDSPYTFQWLPSTNLIDLIPVLNPYFFTKTPGTYQFDVVVTSLTDGCDDTDRINIVVAPPVNIAIQPGNTTIKYGSELQLDAIQLSTDPLMYTWMPNDGSLNNPNINNPIAKPLDSTTYIVYGMNEWGCRDTAFVTIDVEMDMNEYIPTAFTPNGDGLNDLFRIRGLKYQRIVDFKVYNRWGQLVYDYVTGDAQGWNGMYNGQPADMGVYNYSIILAKPGQIDKLYKGNVTLIR
jgi:gliding motility-associated-like protein